MLGFKTHIFVMVGFRTKEKFGMVSAIDNDGLKKQFNFPGCYSFRSLINSDINLDILRRHPGTQSFVRQFQPTQSQTCDSNSKSQPCLVYLECLYRS